MTLPKISRRKWLGLACLSGFYSKLNDDRDGGRLKIGLNAYSFNKPLTDGRMNLHQLLEFCADHQIDAVDLTAYYFPGYPAVPPDEFLHEIKYNAFRKGIDISGTGVRNEFVTPDPEKRRAEIELVKRWILAASKLGAPVIRIFAGHLPYDGHSREEVLGWVVNATKECVEFGRKNGVIVAVQNHNAFLRTAQQTIELIEKVDSPWFGQILDIGSFRQDDPYREIEKCIPYAVNWQIKELVYQQGKEEKTDLARLFRLIKATSYRGYLPLETLGGDPFEKVPVFLQEARTALKN